MKTTYKVYYPNGSKVGECDLPDEPGYDLLKALLVPLLFEGLDYSGELEHVFILGDEPGERADMFVDDVMQLRSPLPAVNTEATRLYRAASVAAYARVYGQVRAQEREQRMPDIRGNAVVFDRKVWF